MYPDIAWLPMGELQGDALLDLQTTGNTLSVYEINDEHDKERVTVALAANRETLSNLDYAVFDDSSFASLGIIAELQQGTTPDVVANQLHHNLTNLTLGALTGLAHVISNVEHPRIGPKQVKARINEAIASGTLATERIKPELLARLG